MFGYLEYVIELVFSIGLFLNAMLFVPQAIEIYKTKDVKGQSLITFVGFNLIQLFTIIHAYIHGDYLLLIGYLLSLITCGCVTALIIRYKK